MTLSYTTRRLHTSKRMHFIEERTHGTTILEEPLAYVKTYALH